MKDAIQLWNKLPWQVKQNGYFYSDDWDAYKGIFPRDRHSHSKQKSDTNHLERFNNTVRQSVSKFVRETLSFSKKEDNHISALAYLFLHYNIERQKICGM